MSRNPDVKVKKNRNMNCASGDGGASSGGSGGQTFPANSGSPRSSSLWGSRAAQANLLSHPMHGAGAVGGSGSGGGGVGSAASNHMMPDTESSPTPRRRNGHQLAASPSNTDYSNQQSRPTNAQNAQHDLQQQQLAMQAQQQPQLQAQQPPNLPQPPHNQQQQQLNLPQPQHQQPPAQNQPQNQPQNQQLQQQPPPPQQGQVAAQRQDNNEDERPNPFDLNNEMELGIGHLLKDRMASLCANDILADVEFIVGTPEGAVAAVVAPPMGGGVRTIPAHKCILVTSSSVFYAMFCGGLANRSKGKKVAV